MIAYDLECCQGHRFEGWFDSGGAFEEQLERGLLTCPICGSSEVNRLLSTFGIARRRPNEGDTPTVANPQQKIIQFLETHFEDVGSDFAKEALKIHYGVTDSRNIRGVSSPQEEETLRKEGIEFFKIPVPAESSCDED